MSPRRSQRPGRRPRDMDEACREVMSNVDGGVVCGVVDLESQELLGFHSIHRLPALEAAVPAAAVSLLGRGSWRKQAERSGPPPSEAHVVSKNGYHFVKVLDGGKTAVMLVTTRATNAALGSALLTAVLPKVEPRMP